MHLTLALKSSEPRLLQRTLALLRAATARLGGALGTPLALAVHPLPTRCRKFTLLKSPHIDKKSREQVECRTSGLRVTLGALPSAAALALAVDVVKCLKADGVQLKVAFGAPTRL